MRYRPFALSALSGLAALALSQPPPRPNITAKRLFAELGEGEKLSRQRRRYLERQARKSQRKGKK